jgi:hypothetical protein
MTLFFTSSGGTQSAHVLAKQLKENQPSMQTARGWDVDGFVGDLLENSRRQSFWSAAAIWRTTVLRR